MLNISKFVQGLVATIVGIVLVVTVAVPIIPENQVGTGASNSGAINSMIIIIDMVIFV